MSPRQQNLALVALGVLTAVLVGAALVRAAAPPEGGVPEPAEVTGVAETGRATEQPTGSSDENGQTETGADDQPSGPLEEAQQILTADAPVTLVVLGDSTSNTRDEWVHLWAEELAEQRPVDISHWDETSQAGYVEPDVLSESGDGSALTIWSGSQSGSGPTYPLAALETVVPEQPDLVIYSYGHNITAEQVPEDFGQLHEGITGLYGEVPTLAVLQNPQLGDANADVREAVADWAESNGVGTINVAEAFLAEGNLDTLMSDAVHPDADGQQLWAATVSSALG
ncbi:SGNH/GDSL hydrolase family protein [Ornithinicoccus halotolerans]|uniref:SGNH/GDSL hydrolase family protein n=1 Tax=Ornithinicoccus halotolerans TaxID=1748220 RepID=UPI001296C87C|nr:SGNH/GDSL hydrolase family protein [Ornithinicoccus halotolerans]